MKNYEIFRQGLRGKWKNKDAKEFQKCQQVKEQAVHLCSDGHVETVLLCHGPCWAYSVEGKVFTVIKLLKEKEDMYSSTMYTS